MNSWSHRQVDSWTHRQTDTQIDGRTWQWQSQPLRTPRNRGSTCHHPVGLCQLTSVCRSWMQAHSCELSRCRSIGKPILEIRIVFVIVLSRNPGLETRPPTCCYCGSFFHVEWLRAAAAQNISQKNYDNSPVHALSPPWVHEPVFDQSRIQAHVL